RNSMSTSLIGRFLCVEGRRMSTADELFRLSALLPELAHTLFAEVCSQFGEPGNWIAAILDVRYFPDNAGKLFKVLVELPRGELGQATLSVEGSLRLSDLGSARAEGKDRWYGLRLRVTADGDCETTFDYDPDCVGDKSFFNS